MPYYVTSSELVSFEVSDVPDDAIAKHEPVHPRHPIFTVRPSDVPKHSFLQSPKHVLSHVSLHEFIHPR